MIFPCEAKIVTGKIKEKWLRRQREEPTPPLLPLFIYTPKDSRLRFLAPKHTSRFLFQSEVPHSTERLGDRAEASWGQGTSVPQAIHDISHSGYLCQGMNVWQSAHVCACWKKRRLLYAKTVRYVQYAPQAPSSLHIRVRC